MRERVIRSPETGEEMTFLVTGEETNGSVLRILYRLEPGGGAGGYHVHPNQEMRILVKSGTLACIVAGKPVSIVEGQEVVLPAGTPHAQENKSDATVEVVETYTPALNMQQIFEGYFALIRAGRHNGRGRTDLLPTAVLFRDYRESFRLASRPLNLLITLIAPVATALGYRRLLQRATSR